MLRLSLFIIFTKVLVHLEHCKECRLGHLHITNLAHTFLTLLLLLQQLTLTADITTITLGSHILTHLTHSLSGNNLCTNGRLNGNIKLLAGDELFEFLAHLATEVIGVVGEDERRECIHRLAIEQNIEFREAALTIANLVVVKRGITPRDALQLIVEVEDNLRQRHIEVNLHPLGAEDALQIVKKC